MGNQNQFDRELLSAYLDDMLVGDELSAVESLLKSDESARQYLAALRAQSSSLSALPISRLPSGFANRVLAAARTEAAAQGLPSDHFVIQRVAAAQTEIASNKWLIRNRRHLEWMTSLAAGVIICIVSSSYFAWFDRAVNSTAGFDKIAFQAPVQRDHVDRDSELGPGIDSPGVESRLADGQRMNAEPKPAISNYPLSPFGDVNRNGNPLASQPAPQPNPTFGDPSGGQVVKTAPVGLKFLMVVDLTVTQDALRNKRFDSILHASGIEIVAPIIADAKLDKALADSKMVVKQNEVAPSDNADNEGSQAAFVFVQANLEGLDKAIMAMFDDMASFPEVSLNIAMESNDQNLLEQLESHSSNVKANRAQAIAMKAEDRDLESIALPGFDVGPRRGQILVGSLRKKPIIAVANPGNVRSPVLFVLRETP
ncbi:MAG: hypothetical protein U0892_19680 [Pirellulales bacterium]